MVVYSVQFSGNGKYLLSSDFDGVVQIYETGKFEVIAKTEKTAENRVILKEFQFSFSLIIFLLKFLNRYIQLQRIGVRIRNTKMSFFQVVWTVKTGDIFLIAKIKKFNLPTNSKSTLMMSNV